MDKLQQIFNKQARYLKTLEPIYVKNGFLHKALFPYPINDRHAQEQFRLLAWRINEEVYEALEEWSKPEADVAKYQEEVSDVLHFLVEFAVCAGITTVEFATGGDAALVTTNDYLDESFRRVGYYPNKLEAQQAWGMFLASLAKLMMQFRQRPWRTDNRETDFTKVKHFLGVTWFAFCAACRATGIGPATLSRAYFRKGMINDQRRKDALGMPHKDLQDHDLAPAPISHEKSAPGAMPEAPTSVDYDNDCAP